MLLRLATTRFDNDGKYHTSLIYSGESYTVETEKSRFIDSLGKAKKFACIQIAKDIAQ